MMKNSNAFQRELQGKLPQQMGGLDPLVILDLLKKNWYYFVIALLAAVFCARFYISHTMPSYRVSNTILVNQTEDRSLVNNEELLQGLGLQGGMRSLENQIMILRSRGLTERALKELPFEVEFYVKTFRNQLSLYPNNPVRIISEEEIPLPRDTEFSIYYLGNQMFRIESESEFYNLNKQASFGETIEVPEGTFSVVCDNEGWFIENASQKLFFVVHSSIGLINYFNSRLEVESLSNGGSLLRIALTGTNRAMDVDFLNKLAEVFQSISLDKKNIEAERRIQFIDDQLVGITDSLVITENQLQQFRSSHKVMDLSAQGQVIINQLTGAENERARLTLEANYYDYLSDYLAKDATGKAPAVPITMGITDPGLTRLVTELAELQGQLSDRGAGEMNPLQNILIQRIRSTKEALLETLNGLKRANSLARSDNMDQINKTNSKASALPVTERQLLGIERKFRLNDELYTWLLRTRAEQQMQKASNMADVEMIDPASVAYSIRVSPNTMKIHFIALVIGFGIPFIIIFINFLFNNKLKIEDINKITDLPITGHIPHNGEKTNTVVFDYPGSMIAEAYRLLRSRMQFFTKEATSPVILITSTLPEDGKTFTAINLASVYSLLGRKTILIGFDLRKPKIYQDFNLNNEKGVSTWLIGKDKLNDIIQETSFKNLSIISAGPIPPNPSELTAMEKTEELLKLLKESYDLIIIDSSPIGIVSDTFHLASLADAFLLVVRPGKTLRDMLEITLAEIYSRHMRGVSLVINDIQSNSKHYGYGEKYGYTNDKVQKKHLFKKK
jgi:capsular exopolysaccharide synthesis family protein